MGDPYRIPEPIPSQPRRPSRFWPWAWRIALALQGPLAIGALHDFTPLRFRGLAFGAGVLGIVGTVLGCVCCFVSEFRPSQPEDKAE